MQQRFRVWTGLFACDVKEKCMMLLSWMLVQDGNNNGKCVNVCPVYITLGEFITIPFLVEIVLLTEMPDLLTALYKK